MGRIAAGAALLTMCVLCAAPAYADQNTFAVDVRNAGVPAEHVMTLQMWAPMACKAARQRNLSDEQVAAYMITDVDDIVAITPAQATLIWASAQKNVC